MAAEKPSNLFWKKGENAVEESTNRSKGGRQRGQEGGARRTRKQHPQRRPSLKELCLEDKRRVRQLIEELARVSSEKEMAEERLRGERKAFQELLLQLRSEHREVVKEKQELESELHASQLNLQSMYMHSHTEPTQYREQPGSSHPVVDSAHSSTVHSSLPQQHPTTLRNDCFPERNHYTQPVQPSGVSAESQRQRVVRVESILAMPARARASSVNNNPSEGAPSTAVHVPGYSVPVASDVHTYADHTGTSNKFPKSHAFNGNVVTSLPSQFVTGYTSMTLNAGPISDCVPAHRPESTTPSLLTWTSLPAATPPTTPPREEPVWCTGEDATVASLPCTSSAAPRQDTGGQTYSTATQTSPVPLSSVSPTPQTSVMVGVETGPACSQMQDAQVQTCIGSQSPSYSPPTSPRCFISQSVQHHSPLSPHTQSGEKEMTRAAHMAWPPHPSLAAECPKPQGCLEEELLPAEPKFVPQESMTETFASAEVQAESLIGAALLNAQHTVQAIQSLSHVNSSAGAYSGTASGSWRHSDKGELQASSYVDSGCDNESGGGRPLSPTELAVSLNQSTSDFGKLSGAAQCYSSHRNLKAQLQHCAESEEMLDDAQVISDLFFI